MTTSPMEQSELERVAARYERLLAAHALMIQVSREIGPALDFQQVLATVLRAMQTLVDFEGGNVSLLDGDALVAVIVDPPSSEAPLRVARGSGVSGRVLLSGAAVVTDDLRADERFPEELRRTAAQHGVASYLCVPLICLGETIGVIEAHSSRPEAFDAQDQVLLEGLATQVAGAIESARRYEMISQLEVLKSDFIARVSHELRTPITIMSGFVNTLLANHDRLDNDTRQRMLARIDVAAARLSGLIDQLLMLSRLEAGVVAATVEVVDVASLLEMTRRESEQPDAVEIDCDPDLRLSTDRALVVRALGYLVDNALKYTGGCRLVASGTTIEVIDDGPGIPPEKRAEVFERFTRANHDTSIAGMGIGLPMARTLLSAAGADLTLGDAPDATGTRLVIRFW